MRLVAVILAGLLLTGCAALVVGGAAVGGYQVGKDERSASQIAKDGTINATIKSKLIADKIVSAINVNVDTYNSQVTLTGTVGSYVERDQAGRVAQSVDGVASVDNKLKVVSK